MYIQVRFAIMGLQEIVENIHSSYTGVWGFKRCRIKGVYGNKWWGMRPACMCILKAGNC
jgi:hypothetical protein